MNQGKNQGSLLYLLYGLKGVDLNICLQIRDYQEILTILKKNRKISEFDLESGERIRESYQTNCLFC